jgi:hypothetical protein
MEDTTGRRCLCNGLIAAIGLGQRHRVGAVEPPVATIGQDLSFLPELVGDERSSYKAADVVAYLLGVPSARPHDSRAAQATGGAAGRASDDGLPSRGVTT